MKTWLHSVAVIIEAVARWSWAQVDLQDVAIAVAIGLLAYGFSLWWRPGAYVAPAVVLLWIYLPSRYVFIVSPPNVPEKRKTREQ